MSCHKYHHDIELLSSLDDDAVEFQHVISHIKHCPNCLARYHVARGLDNFLETKLNELDPPAAFPAQIMDNLRYSLMPELRRVILERLKATTIHPPARWVHQQIEPLFPSTSLKSVCRHLSILRDEGDILELDFREGFKRFDGNVEPHCHFICLNCKGVYDIFRPPQQLIDLDKIDRMGYEVLEPRLELQGICKNCRVG
jgi:Fur family peroxide stress response transcriptional regulator